MKVNSQYMHIIRFNINKVGHMSKNNVVSCFQENKFVALTHKTLSNKIFSFGRDHGYYGRIFNQTVISTPSLLVVSNVDTTTIIGYCFTPQDGNSLLSSAAACLYGIHKQDFLTYMKEFDEFLFSWV